jgi:hypothetical protein
MSILIQIKPSTTLGNHISEFSTVPRGTGESISPHGTTPPQIASSSPALLYVRPKQLVHPSSASGVGVDAFSIPAAD